MKPEDTYFNDGTGQLGPIIEKEQTLVMTTNQADKDREAAEEWADEHHITAIVDKPESNILFAKQLAAEAFLAGISYARRPNWISVKERLPERQGEFLVFSKEDPRLSVKTIPYLGKACFAISSREGQQPTGKQFKTGFYIESIYEPTVTHWLPLPELPTVEGE